MSLRKSLFTLRQFTTTGVGYNRSCCPKPDYGPMEVQRSIIANGIRVAAAKPLGAQISACTIMYQVGSRDEVEAQLGVSHFLRAASSGTGCGYSGYSKTRMLQQMGCSITCTTDRQRIAYTLRCPMSRFAELQGYLLDAAARGCFPQWEIDDRKKFIHKDLWNLSPQDRIMDMIQTASFSGPLANSMYCNDHRVDGMSGDTINCFSSTHFRSDVCTVASYGLPFEQTINLAEKVQISRDIPKPREWKCSKPRGGFEYHDLGRGSDTWIAVAVPGCGTTDIANLFQHAIVAAAAGTGDMQLSQHNQDRIPMSPLGTLAGDDVETSYQAFNISYCETGIFGILAKTKYCSAWDTAIAAAASLKAVGDLDFKQIDVGKARLKLALAMHDEDPALLTEGLALQLANNLQLDDARQAIEVVDCICADEVAGTAKKLSSNCKQMAVAVVGDIGAVPHDRELVCG